MDTKQLNNRQNQKQRQKRLARLEIVAELFKKGYSVRQICQEVQVRLQLPKLPSPNLIQQDKKLLLDEWRENRLANTDEYMTLALARIDDCLIELWEAWEKSKEDYTEGWQKQKAVPTQKTDKNGNPTGEKGSKVIVAEQQQANKRGCGNVAYITEIRHLLAERNKLLGIYAPERSELTGKDGSPLMASTQGIDLNELSEQELETLYAIAAKRDKKEMQ